MNYGKALLSSKTFWVAVIQAVAGIVVVALTELDLVGYIATFKSVIDIVLLLDRDWETFYFN